MNESRRDDFPSFEEGSLRPSRKMSRYLSQGAAGEVRTNCNSGLTSPATPNLGSVTFVESARPPLLEGGVELIFSRFFQFAAKPVFIEKTNQMMYPRSPNIFPAMLQRWHEIAFFHWSCEPNVLRQHLPRELQPDTFEGKAWISLTPFLLTGLRPPVFPRALGLTFPEMNLRTYVVGPEGPAIWFFSLDAASRLAVWGARATFGLPYFWADMAASITPNENSYTSDRSNGAHAVIRIWKETPITDQTALDIFLTARFRLYSTYRRRLITAEVQHAPWELNRVRILEFEENIRSVMGVEFLSQDFLAHHSRGVDTRIGLPHRVSMQRTVRHSSRISNER
jgi:uncharacterized protein